MACFSGTFCPTYNALCTAALTFQQCLWDSTAALQVMAHNLTMTLHGHCSTAHSGPPMSLCTLPPPSTHAPPTLTHYLPCSAARFEALTSTHQMSDGPFLPFQEVPSLTTAQVEDISTLSAALQLLQVCADQNTLHPVVEVAHVKDRTLCVCVCVCVLCVRAFARLHVYARMHKREGGYVQ